MGFGVPVRAPVGQDDEFEVEVGRLPQGGEHDSGRRDAGENQPVDSARTQHDVQVTSGEGADPTLGDEDVSGLRCDTGYTSRAAFVSPKSKFSITALKILFALLTSG